MSSPDDLLTRERWLEARRVLFGERPEQGVSLDAAARAAGITRRVLRSWIERSREQRIEDEPWVHQIAKDVDDCPDIQGEVLEDVLFDHAVNGVDAPVVHQGKVRDTYKKFDHRLAERMLAVRDRRYVKTERKEIDKRVTRDATNMAVLFEKFKAASRLAKIRSGEDPDAQPVVAVVEEPVPATLPAPERQEELAVPGL